MKDTEQIFSWRVFADCLLRAAAYMAVVVLYLLFGTGVISSLVRDGLDSIIVLTVSWIPLPFLAEVVMVGSYWDQAAFWKQVYARLMGLLIGSSYVAHRWWLWLSTHDPVHASDLEQWA